MAGAPDCPDAQTQRPASHRCSNRTVATVTDADRGRHEAAAYGRGPRRRAISVRTKIPVWELISASFLSGWFSGLLIGCIVPAPQQAGRGGAAPRAGPPPRLRPGPPASAPLATAAERTRGGPREREGSLRRRRPHEVEAEEEAEVLEGGQVEADDEELELSQ